MESGTLPAETVSTFAGLLADSATQMRGFAVKNGTALQHDEQQELAHVLHVLDQAIGHVRHVFGLPHHVDVIAPTDMSEQTPFPA